MSSARRLRRSVAVAATVACTAGCGGTYEDGGGLTPITPAGPQSFDVTFVRSAPAAGGTLMLSGPNDTPVSLSVTFSVAVPSGQQGTYQWNTALQAAHPVGTGFVVPVVNTAFQRVTLGTGVQEVTITGFRTTNAICIDPRTPAATLTLDVDVRTGDASLQQQAPQVLGKQFNVTYALQCE